MKNLFTSIAEKLHLTKKKTPNSNDGNENQGIAIK